MYVSGTLKNKTIQFYREKLIDFDSDYVYTEENSLSYEGELTFAPRNSSKEIELIKRQNIYISKLKEQILSFIAIKFFNNRCSTEYFYFDSIIKNIFYNISQSDCKFTVALLECLKDLVKNVDNCHLSLRLSQFQSLVTYTNDISSSICQTEFDIISRLFLNHQSYDIENIFKQKILSFRINEREITDSKTYELYRLGEFIAPNRLAFISQELFREELSKVIVPIYFAIKDESVARNFLVRCQKTDLDSEQIEKNAMRLRIPDNLIQMVRR